MLRVPISPTRPASTPARASFGSQPEQSSRPRYDRRQPRARWRPVGAENSDLLFGSGASDHAVDDRVPSARGGSAPRDGPRSNRPDRGEPPAAPSAWGSHPPDPQAPAATRARQARLGSGPPRPARLASAPGGGHARDGRALAPPGLAPVLALALARPDGPAAPQRRGPGADRADSARQPRVGRRAHPRRAAPARDRGQQGLGPAGPPARIGAPAQPDLAD